MLFASQSLLLEWKRSSQWLSFMEKSSQWLMLMAVKFSVALALGREVLLRGSRSWERISL